jgi:hypothetical protein
LFNSSAARRIAKIRDALCRYKLLPFRHGYADDKMRVLTYFGVDIEEADRLQIFLPWSWTNRDPQPVLSTYPEVFTDYPYFPYNEYIFSRALLTEEEREDSECLCFHFMPEPTHLSPLMWIDWPCGCRKHYHHVNTHNITVDEIELLSMEHSLPQPNMAYILAPLGSDAAEGMVRFTVPHRRTKFPTKKARKRRNTFGRALSLTDRKHYKKGRSNSKT